MNVVVLRLGHRRERDKRITTHCALVARAFGAKKIILSGEKDGIILNGIQNVVKNWGGKFEIKYDANWSKIIRRFKGTKIHLTVYGNEILERIGGLRKQKNILIIIGGAKVPSEVYKMVDYNISIGNQPHSEVAALAVFLHELFEGKELKNKFKKARIKVIPHSRSKKIITSM